MMAKISPAGSSKSIPFNNCFLPAKTFKFLATTSKPVVEASINMSLLRNPMTADSKRLALPFWISMERVLLPPSSTIDFANLISTRFSRRSPFLFSQSLVFAFTEIPGMTILLHSSESGIVCMSLSFSRSITRSVRSSPRSVARNCLGPIWMMSPSLMTAVFTSFPFSMVMLFWDKFCKIHLPSVKFRTA